MGTIFHFILNKLSQRILYPLTECPIRLGKIFIFQYRNHYMKKQSLIGLLFFPILCFSQIIDSAWVINHYTKKEVMIPMRDGVKLFTAIYTPKEETENIRLYCFVPATRVNHMVKGILQRSGILRVNIFLQRIISTYNRMCVGDGKAKESL